jgi:preprotein translocase subunit Sss1
MFSAVVWHWWIGVALFLAALGLLVATGVGYLVKVQSIKYPKKR